MTLKERICAYIAERQGCKLMDLFGPNTNIFNCMEDTTAFHVAIAELIESGNLIELEYTTPAQPERIKSFLLPKGSTLNSGV